MEKSFLEIFTNYSTERYQEVRNLLLAQSSYQTKVNIENIHLFLTYIEAASKKALNRLNAVGAYISDEAVNLNQQAYPLGLLKEDVREKISKMDREAIVITEALQTNDLEPEYEVIYYEDFYKKWIAQRNRIAG